MVDVGEQLQVLLSQEEYVYQTSDYITRMQAEAEADEASIQADQEYHHMDQCRRTATTTSPTARSTTTRRTSTTISGSTSSSSSSSSSSCINKNWREQICKWAYEVVDHFDLNREVVSTAMSHLDRYLGIYIGTVDKNLFQLLAMTCLYLSIKLNEHEHILIQGSASTMETILQLSNGIFKLDEMEKMERELIHTLQWRVHPPTGQVYVNQFLKYLSSTYDIDNDDEDDDDNHHQELQDLAAYTIELAVMDYFFISYKNSDIAIAALLNSIDVLGRGSSHSNNNNNNNNNRNRNRNGNNRSLEQKLNFLSSTSQFLIDVHSSSFIACRDRLSLIYTQANKENVEPPQQQEAQAAAPVQKIPEAQQLQRTISPTSVMAPPTSTTTTDDDDDDDDDDSDEPLSDDVIPSSSREFYQHHQSQFDSSTHDDTISNDYFLDDKCMYVCR